MNIKNIICLLSIVSLLWACDKNETDMVQLPLKVQMSVNEDRIVINSGDTLTITAVTQNEGEFKSEWKLNDKVVSEERSYSFSSKDKGPHTLEYRAYTTKEEFKTVYIITVSYDFNNPYVTQLFEYRPAPGQFINKSPGNLASAQGILGQKGMVTLGAYGGYIVLGFDHTVKNGEGNDIIIYNNASNVFSEPGVIWVMSDDNGNGLPDDTWYELAGSEFNKTGYERNYSVTYYKPNSVTDKVRWTDSKDREGYVERNTFHTQSYYPEWEGDTYTLTGSVLPSTNIDYTIPTNIKSYPFDFGYADNTSGGDKIDIGNAVDKDGKKVILKGINFIKVQTAVQANMGWLGELSTEVLGIADLSLVK
ncbi:cell surface protein [Pseudopedobacter beijingensis]